MAENEHSIILDQYDRTIELYRLLAGKVHGLIEEMLREKSIRVHSVTSRVKDRESLRKKIDKPEKNYADLRDLTDIAGVRIITYFEDDVDKVAKRIEREFSIDQDNTTDKRAALDPDRFGYLTMQHVAEFNPERTVNFEYGKLRGLKFEIQTRSILQHAWAEMEHDLGYKNPASIPKEARRRFSRLAGLLEIADDELRRLRDELETYRRDVRQRIQRHPQEVEIDKDSLAALISGGAPVTEVDLAIANAAYLGTLDAWSERRYASTIEGHAASLRMLGLETIEELEKELRGRLSQIGAFAAEWLEDEDEPTERSFAPGVSLMYLGYVLAAETQDAKLIKRYLDLQNIGQSSNRDHITQKITKVYKAVSAQGY